MLKRSLLRATLYKTREQQNIFYPQNYIKRISQTQQYSFWSSRTSAPPVLKDIKITNNTQQNDFQTYFESLQQNEAPEQQELEQTSKFISLYWRRNLFFILKSLLYLLYRLASSLIVVYKKYIILYIVYKLL